MEVSFNNISWYELFALLFGGLAWGYNLAELLAWNHSVRLLREAVDDNGKPVNGRFMLEARTGRRHARQIFVVQSVILFFVLLALVSPEPAGDVQLRAIVARLVFTVLQVKLAIDAYQDRRDREKQKEYAHERDRGDKQG